MFLFVVQFGTILVQYFGFIRFENCSLLKPRWVARGRPKPSDTIFWIGGRIWYYFSTIVWHHYILELFTFKPLGCHAGA